MTALNSEDSPVYIKLRGTISAAILRGEYRAQFLLKSTNRKGMREALLAALAARPEIARRTTVDVDPVSVL